MFKKINWGLFVSLLLLLGSYLFLYWQDTHAGAPSNATVVTDVAETLSTRNQLKAMRISDSLPHYQYKKIEDSIEQQLTTEAEKNKLLPGWGFTFGCIGMRTTFRTWYDFKTEQAHSKQEYYIALPSYSADPSVSTEIRNDKTYLRYVNWDDSLHKKGHSAVKEIAVSYLPEQKEILLPVSEQTFNGARFTLVILILFYLFMLYVTIGMPINLVLNISKGKVFLLKNIKALFFISFVLLGFFLWTITAPYLIALLLGQKIPSGFYISFTSLVLDHILYLLSGIAVLFIALAFRKGYTLQNEQDLTM